MASFAPGFARNNAPTSGDGIVSRTYEMPLPVGGELPAPKRIAKYKGYGKAQSRNHFSD